MSFRGERPVTMKCCTCRFYCITHETCGCPDSPKAAEFVDAGDSCGNWMNFQVEGE